MIDQIVRNSLPKFNSTRRETHSLENKILFKFLEGGGVKFHPQRVRAKANDPRPCQTFADTRKQDLETFQSSFSILSPHRGRASPLRSFFVGEETREARFRPRSRAIIRQESRGKAPRVIAGTPDRR